MYDLEDIKDRLRDLQKELHKQSAKIDQIIETGIKNTINLEQHMQRTELNEDRIKKLEYWLIGLLGALVVATIVKALI